MEKEGGKLSIRRQCELLGVNRNRLEPVKPGGIRPEEQKVARRIDELHLKFPELGSRRMARCLSREGHETSRRQAGRLMKLMGIEAIYCRPRTSLPGKGHKIYPYLLKERVVGRVDEVWCADITYVPMARGYGYLVAIMDWKSRAVLGWKLSNTMDSDFCVEALKEAMEKTGKVPEIFNTDQGSQFTSRQWIEAVEGAGIRVSMDGKGRWIDNVFIERLWRSVKYEGVYLWAHESLHELERSLAEWFENYNTWKPHEAHDGLTPWQIYQPQAPVPWRQAA